MIDFTEVPDGEVWEFFARDFLQEIGFFIESPPDRGADAGKDLLVTEELKGKLGSYRFRWLVSCKHLAHSEKSVGESHEPNIVERLGAFNADGFVGFYSTLPTAGLNTRLRNLKENGRVQDYKFFDHRLVENHLVRIGFSDILMRYFPQSYKTIKPLHVLFDKYIPLNCKNCGKDLLESLYEKPYSGNAFFVTRFENGKTYVEEICWVCKGECERAMRDYYKSPGISTQSWVDISELVIPRLYLEWIATLLNTFRSGTYVYSDETFEVLKRFISALSQKVLREMTARERERAIGLLSSGPLAGY
jgi:hypothetical protein